MRTVAVLKRDAAAAAAAVAAAEKANHAALVAPYNHNHDVAACQQQLAEMEQKYTNNAVAVASGLPEHANLPDAQEMEKLRAKIAVSPMVTQQLESNRTSAAKALERAKRDAVTAKGALLHEVAIKPALQEFEEAFEALGQAGVRLMAAHRQAYPNENDGSWNPSYQALFGPVGELFTAMNGMHWPNPYRYNIRPGFLAQNRFLPDELGGFAEATQETIALMQEELAA